MLQKRKEINYELGKKIKTASLHERFVKNKVKYAFGGFTIEMVQMLDLFFDE